MRGNKSKPMGKMAWDELIEEILTHEGYTTERIAKEIRVSRHSIERLRQGKTRDPQYRHGSRLMNLYLYLQHQELSATSELKKENLADPKNSE